VLSKPGRQRFRRAVWKDVDHSPALQIHQNRAAVCPFFRAQSSTPTTRSGTTPVSTSTRLMALKIVSLLTGIPNRDSNLSPGRPPIP
jgi:hypothetical protein